jgi:DNA-binding NarL/FixJ family response regulator
MGISRTNFQAQFSSMSDRTQLSGLAAGESPACVICSNHPFALGQIKDAICSDTHLQPKVSSYNSKNFMLFQSAEDQILVLDTCSVENWADYLVRWHREGGSAIAMISSELDTMDRELEMLFLGAAGVLNFGSLHLHLREAIRAVAEGHLWFKREVLHAYVKQTRGAFNRGPAASQNLTTREREIIDLLLQDFSNRVIAQRFNVSERTIKFHVSNILRKLNLSSRKELRDRTWPPVGARLEPADAVEVQRGSLVMIRNSSTLKDSAT